MRDYPRLGEFRKPKPNSGRKCCICSSAPAGIQFVQISVFRGDDEPVSCCNDCRKKHKAEVLAKVSERWRVLTQESGRLHAKPPL
jgi:hypothetical protein